MVWHVARMRERRSAYTVLEGKPEGRVYLEDPGVDWRKILRWFFGKWDEGHRPV